MTGSYDYRLVVLSVLIAICAAYSALELAGRITAATGRNRLAWLGGGAIAMGFGIWSMHYVGMLAFSLPVPILYDWPTVSLSLLAAYPRRLQSDISRFVTRTAGGISRECDYGWGYLDNALYRHGSHAFAGNVFV